MSKVCSKCGFLKDNKEFSFSSKNKDNMQSRCRTCNKKDQKQIHDIKDNPYKVYRLVVDLKAIKPDIELGNHNNLKHEKIYYIGITQKELKDRLNEHICNIKKLSTKKSYFWITKFFKDENIDITKINIRDYVRIELIEEYPSDTTLEQMKKIEGSIVAIEDYDSYLEGKERFGSMIPIYEVINLEHFIGNKNCKDMLMESGIIEKWEIKNEKNA